MDPVTLTREQLYELVWETPTSTLCHRFDLSDVGLAKTCKRHVSAHHNQSYPPR